MAEAVNDKRIAAALDMYVTAFTHAVSRELGSELGPAIQRQMRGMVGAVVQDLLAQPVLDRVEMMVDRITHVAIAGLGQEAARLLTADLGPAIATVIERQLSPAMRSVIEQVGPAMASTVRDQLAVAIGQSLDRELGPRLVSLSRTTASEHPQRAVAPPRSSRIGTSTRDRRAYIACAKAARPARRGAARAELAPARYP